MSGELPREARAPLGLSAPRASRAPGLAMAQLGEAGGCAGSWASWARADGMVRHRYDGRGCAPCVGRRAKASPDRKWVMLACLATGQNHLGTISEMFYRSNGGKELCPGGADWQHRLSRARIDLGKDAARRLGPETMPDWYRAKAGSWFRPGHLPVRTGGRTAFRRSRSPACS